MLAKITRTYIRTYRDSGQKTVYVEFEPDKNGGSVRLECDAERATKSEHMQAILRRAAREGVKMEIEIW